MAVHELFLLRYPGSSAENRGSAPECFTAGMPIRALPRVGDEVTVAYLSARVGGVVAAVDHEVRSLAVLTEEGDTLDFWLNRATGHYLAGGRQSGARLVFSSP